MIDLSMGCNFGIAMTFCSISS